MSFDVTKQTGQPRNSGEWSFSNHALNPKGNEFSFLPPIQGSIDEDSIESSKNGSADSFPTINEQAKSNTNDQGGNGHRLPSIKMLTELPLQQTTYTANYVPINLEGQQSTTPHIGIPPPLNSPSCLNLSAWSLNSPSMNGGIAFPSNNTGPDSYSILGGAGTSRVHGPSNLSPYAFRPIPTSAGLPGFPSMNNSQNYVSSSTISTFNSTTANSQFNSFVDQAQPSKRRSIDGYEAFEPYSSSSRTKRYSFSSYSPQIQSKKTNSDKRSSSEEDDTIIQRRSSFKEIPIQSIVQHLHLSQRDAAKSLGVSVSTLKRRFYSVRDQIGIEKWPTITTTTIQSSQQSLSNVLIKYPIINPVPTTTSTTLETSQTNPPLILQNVKEEDSSSSTNGISSSASCAPLQNQ